MALALPTKTRTWLYSQNNVVVYSSLNQISRETAWGIKEWLKTLGATIPGSSDGTTGAMDGVDRWITAANAGTRAANTTTAHSWIVILLGNSLRLLLDYVGTVDNQFRMSYAVGAYTAAGTPTFSPTATDEMYILGSSTAGAEWLLTTTSGNRIWNGWATADRKNFRVAIGRQNAPVCAFGVEEVDSVGVIDPVSVVFSPSSWGFFHGGTTGGGGLAAVTSLAASYSNGIRGGRARVVVGGIPTIIDCSGGGEGLANASSYTFGNFNATANELQGNAYPALPLTLGGAAVGARGPLAKRVDWWASKTGEPWGAWAGNLEFFNVGDGLLWPWNGTPSVAGTVPTTA